MKYQQQGIETAGINLMKETWKYFFIIGMIVFIFETAFSNSISYFLKDYFGITNSYITQAFGLLMSLLTVILTLLAAMAQMRISKLAIEYKDISFFDAIRDSFNWRTLFRLILFSISTAFVMGLIFGIVFYSFGTNLETPYFVYALYFIFVVLIGLITIRYVLALPDMIIKEKGIYEAINFSKSKISHMKGGKYLIYAFIIYGIQFLFIYFSMGLSELFTPLGSIGPYLSEAITILINSVITAFSMGLIVALYYREANLYNEARDDEQDFEKHLIE